MVSDVTSSASVNPPTLGSGPPLCLTVRVRGAAGPSAAALSLSLAFSIYLLLLQLMYDAGQTLALALLLDFATMALP